MADIGFFLLKKTDIIKNYTTQYSHTLYNINMRLSHFKNTIFAAQKQSPDFSKLPQVSQKQQKIIGLLKKHSTPLFMVDQKVLLNRLKKLKNALEKHWGNFQIAYSFKTNYEIAEADIFRKHDSWAEVVSGKEYQLAKKLKHKGGQIIFNGPYKTNIDLLKALDDEAMIYIDNFSELSRVEKIAKSREKKSHVGIRLNTKIPSLEKSRFGFSIDESDASQAVKKIIAAKHLKLSSFHIHLGTDIDNPSFYKKATKTLCTFMKVNIPLYQKTIKSLDLGGGFPAEGLQPFCKKNWRPRPIEEYIKAITENLKIYFPKPRPLLILEPGRYLVDDAVIFVTKIVNKEISGGKQILTTNAAVTMLPLVYYRPQIIKIFNRDLKERKKARLNTIVYGSTCKEDDILHKGHLPEAEIEDYLIYYITGAYNQNMSSDFIFDKPKTFFI